jgi:hypothetical protein
VVALTGCSDDSGGGEVVERNTPTSATVAAPTFGDHLHEAYGVYVCDRYAAPLADQLGDRYGIHTHEDGLIHVHPTAVESTGAGAVLARFAEEVGLGLEQGSLTLPDGSRFQDGDDCGGAAGTVRVLTWDSPDDPSPEIVEEAPGEVPVRTNGAVLAVVFAPEDAEIPQPPWAVSLVDPDAAEQGRPSPTV